MPIYTAGAFRDPYTQADLPASASAVRRATFDQAVSDLLAPSLFRSLELNIAEKRGALYGYRQYDPRQAEDFMAANGLAGQFKFEDREYNQLELSILAKRKTAELKRQAILSRAEDSGSTALGRFGITIATSFLDPLTVGTGFVPVIGPARYAGMLERAGTSALARAGVRAQVGALEGAVGAAAVEPIIYGAHAQEQADYTLADSLLNIGIGGPFGGGLHVVGGAVSDALKRSARPSRAILDEAEAVVKRAPEPVTEQPAADVGALSGPIGVPDEYRAAAVKLSDAMRAARDIDLTIPAEVSRMAGRPVQSLSQFIKSTGGIADDGGELSARDVTSRSMPGLVRRTGSPESDMDAVRQRIFDAGYFPDRTEYGEISDSEIFDAIADDVSGKRRYPVDVADLIARVHADRDFMDRLGSQGIERGTSVDDIAVRLRELDDEAIRSGESRDGVTPEQLAEYERSVAAMVESTDPRVREAALRSAVAQAVTGEPIEARPVFDSATMPDAARRIADPDQRPLADPAAVERADDVLAQGESADLAAVQRDFAEASAGVNAVLDELDLDEGGKAVADSIRAELEASRESVATVKNLARAASLLVACAMRHAL
jgi:hypothetical protein